MEDNFKKFVEDQKEGFEIYNTDNEVLWKQIDQKLNTSSQYYWLKIAASILLLFVAISTLYIRYTSSILPDEVIEAENYYSSHVTEQLKFIKSNNIEIDPLILQDLAELDKEYEELKNDLKDNMDNEDVIGAMMQTYRVKLKILEQILNEIKQDESETNDEISI